MTTIIGQIVVRPIAHHWWRIEHRDTGESLHLAGTVAEALSVAARTYAGLREGKGFEQAFCRALA